MTCCSMDIPSRNKSDRLKCRRKKFDGYHPHETSHHGRTEKEKLSSRRTKSRKNGSNFQEKKREADKNSTGGKVTNGRLTVRHGLFSCGKRSTYAKRDLCIPEEKRARMEEDLHKLIDLANASLKKSEVDWNTNVPVSGSSSEHENIYSRRPVTSRQKKSYQAINSNFEPRESDDDIEPEPVHHQRSPQRLTVASSSLESSEEEKINSSPDRFAPYFQKHLYKDFASKIVASLSNEMSKLYPGKNMLKSIREDLQRVHRHNYVNSSRQNENPATVGSGSLVNCTPPPRHTDEQFAGGEDPRNNNLREASESNFPHGGSVQEDSNYPLNRILVATHDVTDLNPLQFLKKLDFDIAYPPSGNGQNCQQCKCRNCHSHAGREHVFPHNSLNGQCRNTVPEMEYQGSQSLSSSCGHSDPVRQEFSSVSKHPYSCTLSENFIDPQTCNGVDHVPPQLVKESELFNNSTVPLPLNNDCLSYKPCLYEMEQPRQYYGMENRNFGSQSYVPLRNQDKYLDDVNDRYDVLRPKRRRNGFEDILDDLDHKNDILDCLNYEERRGFIQESDDPLWYMKQPKLSKDVDETPVHKFYRRKMY